MLLRIWNGVLLIMSDRQFGPWIGTPMNDRKIDDLLDEAGYGILSLADDGEAYALPVSIGYDGEDIYLAFLEIDPPHRKSEFAEATERACLTISDIQGRFNWQNIIVSGPLHPVEADSDEFDDLLDVMQDNAWFSKAFLRDPSVANVQGYVLEAEEISGQQKRQEN